VGSIGQVDQLRAMVFVRERTKRIKIIGRTSIEYDEVYWTGIVKIREGGGMISMLYINYFRYNIRDKLPQQCYHRN
jgi:hypothetical protein